MSRVTRIHYARSERTLALSFDDGVEATLTAEMLRVMSPSAEVRGHGRGQETLVSGKAEVGIKDVRPVGHYAIQLLFDDGHDSGLFTWAYLRHLADHQTSLWADYLQRLDDAGQFREANIQVLSFDP